jgi:hypothetical protein
MAIFHVHVAVIRKSAGGAGGGAYARYVQREAVEHAAQQARYLQRDGRGHEDLVETGHAHLPSWATSATHFFQMADRYERGGAHRPGTVGRAFEIALPRELTAPQRLELAADIRQTFFAGYPQVYGIHNPIDRRDPAHPIESPHMHVLISERRVTDAIERGPDGPTGGNV